MRGAGYSLDDCTKRRVPAGSAGNTHAWSDHPMSRARHSADSITHNERGSTMSSSDSLFLAGRRAFIGRSGMLLSGAAVALLAGRDALAATRTGNAGAVETDIRILNTALGAEYQAVAAYQLGL